MKDENGARGRQRDVAVLYFTPLPQINRLNNILLGHFKEIREKFIVCLPSSFSSSWVLLNECSPSWCQTRGSGPSSDPGVPCQTRQWCGVTSSVSRTDGWVISMAATTAKVTSPALCVHLHPNSPAIIFIPATTCLHPCADPPPAAPPSPC